MKELPKAFIKAWGEFGEPKRTTQGYGYKYAPMDEVIRATKPALIKNGLGIIQMPVSTEEGRVGIQTTMIHESGESFSEDFFITPAKNDPQSLGSLFTYLRRYSYMAICQLAPEDDDGQAAMPAQKPAQKSAQKLDHTGDYVVQFGKFKGMKLSDVLDGDLVGYVEYIEKQAKKDGKPITGKVAEFISAVEDHLGV